MATKAKQKDVQANFADEVAGEWAKRVIRAEMAKRNITYRDLGERLEQVGAYEEDERVLRNKVARATFSAGFFAQCLAAMGCETLTIDLLTAWREAKYEAELDKGQSWDTGERKKK